MTESSDLPQDVVQLKDAPAGPAAAVRDRGAHTGTVRIGAVVAAIGVALGAFAAHGLKDRLTPDLLAIFETGVRYQMYAALAILVLGALGQRRAPRLLLAGCAIFSGSLYLLTLTGVRWLGAVTPVGGVLLIGGLLLAAVDAGRRR